MYVNRRANRFGKALTSQNESVILLNVQSRQLHGWDS